jgi:hypothetical protein
MKLLDLFKKLGILKSGSTSWKGDAKNRPVEMMTDDTISSGDNSSSKSNRTG